MLSSDRTLSRDDGIHVGPCPNCYLCSSMGNPLYQGLEDRLFAAPGEWSFKQCRNPECGLVWLDPMPIEDDIAKAYQGYHTHQGTRSDMAPSRDLLRCMYRLFLRATGIDRECKRVSLMYLEKTRPGRVLDVGCGSGHLVAQLRALGWQAEGQEVDPEAAARARSSYGVSVYVGSLEEAVFPEATFDVITISHVIEHVHDPIALLSACRRIMKPGGTLVAATPNTESYGHKYFGLHWRGLEPPRHLHLFSQGNLRACARRAGFHTVETWTTSARAEWFYLTSLALREGTDQELTLTHPGLVRRVQAAAFLFTEFWRQRAQPWLGEELVLRTVR